jgi:hypothetical protein
MTGSTLNGKTEKRHLLYDHRPLFMFEDDYLYEFVKFPNGRLYSG